MERIRAKPALLGGLAIALAILATAVFAISQLAGEPNQGEKELRRDAQALRVAADGPVHEGLLAHYLVSTESQPRMLRTVEQEELVRWARWRFSAAELELPEVGVFFLDNTISCGGREGLYQPETMALYICTARKQTILHELAHAWTDTTLSDGHRAAFVQLRGVRSWDDRQDPWELRGTEHAAEIITWALMDRPIHVPTHPGSPAAEPVFRLLSIPNSDVDALAFGYHALTGSFPVFRHASEWESVLDIGNPELRYAR